MSKFLKAVDEKIKPLVDSIDAYIKSLEIRGLVSFYDADWGGIPTQVMFDRICKKLHGVKPMSHWITYLYTEKAIDFSKKINPTNVCFLDYEPHEEINEICKSADKVGIFGHHKERSDLKELCKNNRRFFYFNPRDWEGNLDGSYSRGLPILYPFLKIAENYGIEVSFVAALGLRGYGYRRLYDEMFSSNKKFLENNIDQIIENVNLLISYRLKNCYSIVEALYTAKSPNDESVRRIKRLCFENRLAEKKNEVIGKAIINSIILDDVQIFPIETDFELIKPFVGELDKVRMSARFGTTVCVQYINNIKKLRKISIRTSRDVDVPSLLKVAHEEQKYKNFGGHERSGGFISDDRNFKFILKNFLEIYFSKTGQPKKIELDDLSTL
jgi:hypothetical protein